MQVLKRVQFLAPCRSSLHAMHAAYETMYSNVCSVCIFALESLIICFKYVFMCEMSVFLITVKILWYVVIVWCSTTLLHSSLYAQVSAVYVTFTGPPHSCTCSCCQCDEQATHQPIRVHLKGRLKYRSTQCSCHGQGQPVGSCWTFTHAEASVPKDQLHQYPTRLISEKLHVVSGKEANPLQSNLNTWDVHSTTVLYI